MYTDFWLGKRDNGDGSGYGYGNGYGYGYGEGCGDGYGDGDEITPEKDQQHVKIKGYLSNESLCGL